MWIYLPNILNVVNSETVQSGNRSLKIIQGHWLKIIQLSSPEGNKCDVPASPPGEVCDAGTPRWEGLTSTAGIFFGGRGSAQRALLCLSAQEALEPTCSCTTDEAHAVCPCMVAFMNSLRVISGAHVDPQPGFQPECGIPPCPWGGGGVINGLQEG